MHGVSHLIIQTNGIHMHLAEQGEGPLVVLCHGFPESWYSWRHQLRALSEAGFHAVAPDMRGYGKTERPEAIDQYTMFHLVGDMVGLLDALSAETAVIAGHDWGGPVAWHSALLRPDRFRGIIGLSVPYRQRAAVRPSTVMPQTETALFYQLYFQHPGVAEAEFERDPKTTLKKMLYSASGDAPVGAGGAWEAGPNTGMVNCQTGLLGDMTDPQVLPSWLKTSDIDFYAAEFARTGFRGGLNWYRNIDRNWELLAPYAGAKVSVPALYVAGDRDLVTSFPGAKQWLADLPRTAPLLRKHITLSGCGHWTQQERAADVSSAMIEFLRTL